MPATTPVTFLHTDGMDKQLFLSVAFVEKKEAERGIAAGLLALLGGAGIELVGYLLAVAGFCATAGGAGVGTSTDVCNISSPTIITPPF